jgi:curli production assembly/transport component CsgG
VQSGLGLEYLMKDNFGVRTFAEINLTQSDMLDEVVAGVRDDNYWRFGIGLTYYFSKIKNDKNKIDDSEKEVSNITEPLNNNLKE